jgi:DNA repair exonuclease SbcCD nuclease subunit
MTTFIHTADWQLGKPFSRIDDPDRRGDLRRERLDAIDRVAEVARQRQASFVLVAGDVFDSPRPPDGLISMALARIGAIGLPTYVIPGNHDHGGPGCLWESDHFRREQAALATNLRVLLAAEPVEREDCLLLPCPLLRRQATPDPTDWIRELDVTAFDERPRVVLAHGSTVNFQGEPDEEDEPGQANFIDLTRLARQLDAIDYVALGDWHGFVQVGDKAWYSGTPEADRFPKAGQLPGHVACVNVRRGHLPTVEPVATCVMRWFEHAETMSDDDGPERLDAALERHAGETGVTNLVAKLRLDGQLGLEGHRRLEQLLRTWQARMAHVRIDNRITLAPADDELAALTARADDPLIAGVAMSLTADATRPDASGAVAAQALILLYQQLRQLEGSA